MRRLYQLLLGLFPPDFRQEEGKDAVDTFEELWRDADPGKERARLVFRSFGRLPAAVMGEWVSYLEQRKGRPRGRAGRKRMMGRWPRHARFAVRTLWKAPAFTWSTVLLLGLGVGSATTIFTLVDHVLLRPLPYPDANRLITVEEGSHSGPLFREMQTLGSVEEWGAGYSLDVNLVGEGNPLRLREARVSRRFFSLLGASPARGRLLSEDDFGSAEAVVLSSGAWDRIWGGDPDLIGETIQVDGQPSTVVGVLEPAFNPPEAVVGRNVDLWRPIDWSDPGFDSHERWMLSVVGRLTQGATPDDAEREMDALMERMAPVHENYRERESDAPRLLPVTPLADVTVRGVRTGLGLLAGAVGLLLLVACANVAHLFLARGLGRHREMAVRQALGAETRTLVEQLFIESLTVGGLGGLVGLILAAGGLRVFLALNPEALPRAGAVTLDLRVLGFAAAISVATALVFGLLPALRSIGRDVGDALRSGSRTSTSGRGVAALRGGLVVAEVALSLVLVASAGLLLRSFVAVQTQEPGFQVASIWTIPLTPREVGTPDEYVQAMEEVRASLARVPGVESASYGLTVPLEMTGGSRCCWRSTVTAPEAVGEFSPWFHPVSAGFFSTFSIPILYGRSWSEAEARTDPAPIVVSEAFAVELFGEARSAVNRSIQRQGSEFLIVGVAGNTRHYGLDLEHGPALYLPIEQVPFSIPRAHMAVRMAGAGPGTAQALREAVWAAAPNLPVPIVRRMREWLNVGTAGRRFDSALFGSFGVVALLLAAGGLYGTLLYVAGQRKRELAIRIALGATRGNIERSVLRGGIAVAVAGVALGLFGSWLATRFLESRLWGIERGDPIALMGASGLLLLTALVASWLPARRAGSTDPIETLKAE